MWRMIVDFFRESPQRHIVAQAIVRNGFRVEGPPTDPVIKCGDIRIPFKSLGSALGIDRRTVRATAEDICSNTELCDFFRNLRPAGPSLEGVRHVFGYGVVTIFVESPETPGILSEVTARIANNGIPIRQVLAEDVAIYEEPCLKVITQNPLPGRVIETLSEIKGVRKVIIEK